MARIRAIKPEFWSSPGHEQLPDDPWARLLFIAMWNWADDAGRGVATPRELAGFAFPRDERITSADIRRMLGGIRRAFDVDFYTVGGRQYYAIPSWDTHQKIDRRSTGKHPGPDQGEPWDPNPEPPSDLHKHLSSTEYVEHSAGSVESPSSIRRDVGAGTGEQGNRGTGEVPPSAGRIAPATSQALIGEWIDHCRARPPKNVIGQVAKHVAAMLAEGIDPADVRRGLATWHEKCLHPSTLPSVVNEVMNASPISRANGHRPKASTTDQRVAEGLALAARLEAQEQKAIGA